MFTVIMCGKNIIEDCYNKYHIYLAPFFKNDNFAFCQWNTEAETLDEALPGLKKLTAHKKEWRALIVNDNHTWGFEKANKHNPYNFVDAVKKSYNFSSFDEVKESRAEDEKTFALAVSNPLAKLSIWLCGSPMKNAPILSYGDKREEIENAPDGETYFGILKELGISAAEAEIDRSRDFKFRKLCENFEIGGELFNPPQSVITIAERVRNIDYEEAGLAWSNHTEFDYSQFYLDNLYPEKLRYLISDISYIKGRRNDNLYFDFLTSVMLLASYECPAGTLRSNRVYKMQVDIDADCVRELCVKYNSKLWSTLARIDDISKALAEKASRPVDKFTASECFESDVTVPVDVESRESRTNLRAKTDKIGLSSDSPCDENAYWNEQFHTINKYFIRFLREPRRAVKRAAKEDFRKLNKIEDERALRLDEYQRDDIKCVLEEEERSMVATSTTELFNSAMYNKKMRDADREIRKSIAKRMTKNKALGVCSCAGAAFLIGFLPMIFGNLNHSKQIMFSIVLTLASLAVFLLAGLIYMFVLRDRHVAKFKNFNSVMNGILSEIESGTDAFSKYLSHACNMMREFSVLDYKESTIKKKQNILSNHKRIINEKIVEVNELFSAYVDSENLELSISEEPYDFDFTRMQDYEYVIPYENVRKDICFLQEGCSVTVPVDYVEAVTLKREEFYD